MNIKQLAILTGMCGMLGACAIVTPDEIQSMNNRINQNQKSITSLNKQMGGGAGTVPGQAEMWSQFQAMRQDFNIVRGQLDELTSSGVNGEDIKQLREKVTNLEAAVRLMSSQLAIELPMLDSATAAAAATGATAPAVAPAQVTKPTTPAKPVQPQNADLAKTLYDSGTKAFSDRRYNDAVRIFADFINTYPSHRLISNAHFWQGESYYQL
ncbi:hypothetical protein LJB93_03150, partial [Desulfovibrio sp. OttesenSCG-928-F07]|nr:hypothetical protein [Desulfovibrio sp. OttesenSCG-928-F07]